MRRFSYLLSLSLTVTFFASTTIQSSLAKAYTDPPRTLVPFDFSQINQQMTEEFAKAWRIAKSGSCEYEGVVLSYLMPDGSYQVKALNSTNEYKKFSFTWDDRIAAIFHTHPRSGDPRPSVDDMKIADSHKVLMFTLTLQGMYVYDPGTKKTSAVMYGLDWLDASKWTDEVAMKMANRSPSFASKLVVNSSR